MLDEVQTGVGRTGEFFAFQHEGILPDVMSLAKGLGNGVPIGAFLAAGKAAGVFKPGNHGSTFGGNLLVSRTALTVLEVMQNEGIPAKAKAMGDYLAAQLREKLADYANLQTVRNLGMMIGVELKEAVPDLVKRGVLEQKMVINVTADKVIRLLPPLIMNTEQADDLVARLVKLLE
jgi:acetylornithine aminotransferase